MAAQPAGTRLADTARHAYRLGDWRAGVWRPGRRGRQRNRRAARQQRDQEDNDQAGRPGCVHQCRYLAAIMSLSGPIAAGYAVSAVLRLRSEETEGRADPLLTGGARRISWALGHLCIAAGGTALILAATGLDERRPGPSPSERVPKSLPGQPPREGRSEHVPSTPRHHRRSERHAYERHDRARVRRLAGPGAGLLLPGKAHVQDRDAASARPSAPGGPVALRTPLSRIPPGADHGGRPGICSFAAAP